MAMKLHEALEAEIPDLYITYHTNEKKCHDQEKCHFISISANLVLILVGAVYRTGLGLLSCYVETIVRHIASFSDPLLVLRDMLS